MYKIYQKLKDQTVCLTYLGVFNDSLTDVIINLSRYYLESEEDLSKLRTKVSYLIAECFQNVVRHSIEKKNLEDSDEKDFFQINIFTDKIMMTSCNLLENIHRKEVEDKILNINNLDELELKQLHKEVLSGKGFSAKGGAGLGLIGMAIKSGQKLGYDILPYNEEYSRFFISIELSRDKTKSPPKVSMEEINNTYTKMQDEDKIILYKGEFTEEIVIELTEMMKHNLGGDGFQKSQEKRMVISLIELLQNISIHGHKTDDLADGIFALSNIDDNYIIETGNLLNQGKYDSLKLVLDKIKDIAVEDLTATYRSWLDNNAVTNGLGLLDIARNSNKNFTYSFEKAPEDLYFYTIRLDV